MEETRHDQATETEAESDLLGPAVAGSDRIYLLIQHGALISVTCMHPGSTVTVGRGAGCEVVLDDAKASREHCRIVRRDDGLFVRDLGSHNGTRLREAKIPPDVDAHLFAGDRITIGSCEIVVAAAPSLPREAPTEPLDELELGETIVADPVVAGIYRTARRIAATPATVLIHGETGAGKEVLAERLHRWSGRSGAFLQINCAAVPENLLVSELFGYERGAFTGADRRKTGMFEAATGGTLLLDEIGELSPNTQAQLLRALETRTIQPLGATRPIAVDVRILCATHRDLRAAVGAKQFRDDLYYRISTFVLTLPPLRDRPAEVVLLAERFAAAFAAQLQVPAPRFSAEALASLRAYRWPGNVRELRNAIEHAVVLCDHGVVQSAHLPKQLLLSPSSAADSSIGVRGELEQLERERIERTLATHQGNRTRAAQELGISRRALIYKLHKYGIS